MCVGKGGGLLFCDVVALCELHDCSNSLKFYCLWQGSNGDGSQVAGEILGSTGGRVFGAFRGPMARATWA